MEKIKKKMGEKNCVSELGLDFVTSKDDVVPVNKGLWSPAARLI